MNRISTLLVAFAALALSACDSDSDPVAPAEVPNPGAALVQVLHASADAPAVDVLVNGSAAITGLDYKQSSGQVALIEGTYSIEVQGILPGGNAPVIGPVDLQFADDTIYTIAAVNDVATIEPVVLSQPDTPVSAGATRVWVLHAAANVQNLVGGPVDVYVTAPDADLVGQAPLGSFNFKETLPADAPVELTAGDYQIRVGVGTPGDPGFLLAYDSGTVTLPAGADLLIAAVPNSTFGESPVSLVVLNDTGASEIFNVGTPAGLRVGHLSPDAPTVDVYANQEELLADVPYPVITDTLETPAGTYTVEVSPANLYPGTVVIGPADIELAAGTTTDVLAVNTLAAIEPLVLSDDRRQVATNAKVRIVHASPSAGNVDIYVTAPGADITAETPLLTDVAFKANTGYLALAAGGYEVNVTPTGDNTTVAIGPVPLTVSDSGVYTAIARDPLPGQTEFALELLLDFNAN